MKLDILVFAAHPDDAELSCSGTIASHIAQGRKVGVVDFTKGEMGTRGTPQIRLQEASEAAAILGLQARENLGFKDVYFENDKDHQLEVAKMIRKYRPDIILANAVSDRHPDHGRAAQVVKGAWFLSGLAKVHTSIDGKKQEAWRPGVLYNYIQSIYINPDFVVDVSAFWDIKIKAIMAYKSQFYDPTSEEPETYVSSPGFMNMIEARASDFGHSIGTEYGEGFTVNRNIGVTSLNHLL
jgi:N-acetylglucosamine malate deacetylase 1